MNIPKVSNFRRRSGARARLRAAGTALLCTALTAPALALPPADAPAESLARVRAAAEDLMRMQTRDAGQAVHVHAAELDQRLRLARCPQPLAASLSEGAQPSAHMTVRVSCGAARSTWAVYVPVIIESDISVLVLRQSAVRGARLTPAQVAHETRRVSGFAVGYITDIDSLEHHTLARSLPAGAALTADALSADYIVHQGQEVTLIASAPGVSVRASGRALEDGREGARVRVQNLVSLKVVQGVVAPSGMIEVAP